MITPKNKKLIANIYFSCIVLMLINYSSLTKTSNTIPTSKATSPQAPKFTTSSTRTFPAKTTPTSPQAKTPSSLTANDLKRLQEKIEKEQKELDALYVLSPNDETYEDMDKEEHRERERAWRQFYKNRKRSESPDIRLIKHHQSGITTSEKHQLPKHWKDNTSKPTTPSAKPKRALEFKDDILNVMPEDIIEEIIVE